MLTQQKLKAGFTQILLHAAALLFIVVCLTSFLIQQQNKQEAKSLAKINAWLNSRISQLEDPGLNSIWDKLSQKLRSYHRYLSEPELYTFDSTIFKPRKFTKKNVSTQFSPYYTEWSFSSEIDKRKVNYGFAHLVSNRSRRTASSAFKHLNAFIYQIKLNFNPAPNQRYSLDAYSEKMLDVFDLKQEIRTHFPELRIYSVFVGSITTKEFATYPAINHSYKNFKLTERPWYVSATRKKPASEKFKIMDSEDFGLVGIYTDFVSKAPLIRTFWYKTPDNYVIGVDFYLTIEKTVREGLFSDSEILDSLAKGLLGTLPFLLILLLIYIFPGNWWQVIARKILFKQLISDASISNFKIKPTHREYMRYDTREEISDIRTQTDSTSVKKIGTISWRTLQAIEISQENIRDKTTADIRTTEQTTTLNPQDDLSIRGKEKFTVFRREQGEGLCRLCNHPIPYQANLIDIGEVTVIHRRSHEPLIDSRLNIKKFNIDVKTIEESIKWQTLQGDFKKIGAEFNLELYPTAKVSDEVQKLTQINHIIDKYHFLNEGRFASDDCVPLSQEIFKNKNIEAICKISYFRHLINRDKELAIKILCTGSSIRRILLAETEEKMHLFLQQYHEILTAVLDRKPDLKLYRANLTSIALDNIKRYPEWDFAVLYSPGGTSMVFASESRDHSQSHKIKGYLSWREADIKFHEVLYQRLEDVARIITKDDLKGYASS